MMILRKLYWTGNKETRPTRKTLDWWQQRLWTKLNQ